MGSRLDVAAKGPCGQFSLKMTQATQEDKRVCNERKERNRRKSSNAGMKAAPTSCVAIALRSMESRLQPHKRHNCDVYRPKYVYGVHARFLRSTEDTAASAAAAAADMQMPTLTACHACMRPSTPQCWRKTLTFWGLGNSLPYLT